LSASRAAAGAAVWYVDEAGHLSNSNMLTRSSGVPIPGSLNAGAPS
jgi:hypothetical protein